MPHAYTEDQLVEQPVIGLFAELDWQTVSAMEETFGATGTLLTHNWRKNYRRPSPPTRRKA
jgi:hypothetical protein